MRFALAGAGVIGQVHARLIAALPGHADLAVVVDTDEDRARKLATEYGCAAVADLAEACARPDVDAVAVCLPSGLHADAAVLALRAGKHVLVEKPLDVTLAAADRITEAERASGRTVGVISQRRFQPAPAFVHRAIADGRLGRITSGIAESTFWRGQDYYDSGGWRGTLAGDGGGALMNQGIHAVDLLLWMMGEPVEVQAYAGRLAHERIDVEDTVAATVRFASGAIGTITATTAAYPGLPVRLAVHGDGGSAVIEREDLAYFHSAADARPEDPSDHNQAVPFGGEGGQASIDAAHRDQYLDFIAAVRDGRPPLVGTQQARRALHVVLGVYESARTGAPVAL
ncbi:Gfo/Idh/MocA family protein [Actinacidiphila acidipaludis]|uniref:Gfo/Idh/MocA family oxidoreductase n=1 Tax=Actinacidiphila acidipaludis TaxID=2873382 RepID=A0ABS7QAY4_9ACTN|nr:Gfo/Idh/MocA family oxidoreductase [Streptomyces acidipaludis]MBY8880301.1 Gfo/Idh/MocA family oxidoreductase [Streptomyces acidipaludis]